MISTVFLLPTGGKLGFGDTALEQMLSLRQTEADSREAGGVLIGRHILATRDLVVDEVTVPMRGDRRTRTTFRRSRRPHQKVVDARWSASGGRFSYLGEWHTHPESSPSPSKVDLCDWRRRLVEDEVDGAFLLFAIVGIRDLRVWVGRRDTLDLVPLNALPGGLR